jgi:hypothetical protein
LDAFAPYIGKYSAGKIALETGDEAIFDLDDLLPPEKTKKEGSPQGKGEKGSATGGQKVSVLESRDSKTDPFPSAL